MHSMMGILGNIYAMCPLLAYFSAQTLKILIHRLIDKKWDWSRFWGSGGMPSSHTSTVISLCMLIGFVRGFETVEFAISAVFAIVVMYDACGVRRETGKQGAIINEILAKVLVDGKPISDDEFKTLVGHTPFEVAGGALVGLMVTLLFIWVTGCCG